MPVKGISIPLRIGENIKKMAVKAISFSLRIAENVRRERASG
jgi:hypothetical protein